MKSLCLLLIFLLSITIFACESDKECANEVLHKPVPNNMVVTWFTVDNVNHTRIVYINTSGASHVDSFPVEPNLQIHLIGKSLKWAPKDSIIIDSEQVEVIIPITETYIPLECSFKKVETKIAGDNDITFRSHFNPPVTREQLIQRLQKAVDNKEHVVFTVDEVGMSNGIGFKK